jgi:ribosome-associated toxin RatA of RatAB toxin-antitoxin module
MESISLSRTIGAPPEEVRPLVEDVEPFMRAAKFDTVAVDGDRLTIENGFAIARIELDLRLVDDPDTVLAYEQHDGIFEEMWTGYEIEATEAGTNVTARTDFELDVSIVGGVLDATVIKRQRTRELRAQFDYLERETDS